MKKFAKMSLVAAVAVAGFTSTASAGSLEEAVKNTAISGKVYTEFQSNTNNQEDGTTSGVTDFDFDIKFKSKVNDNITAITELEADSSTNEDAATTAKELSLKKIYLNYSKNNLTLEAGRIGSSAPVNDGDRYEGFNVSYKLNGTTLMAQYGVNNDDTQGDVSNFAAKTAFSTVKLEAWYTSYAGAANDLGKTITFATSTAIAGVDIVSRYSTTAFNTEDTEDGVTLRLDAKTTLNNVKIAGTYLMSAEAGASAVTDSAAKNTYELSQLTAKGLADASLMAVSATVPIQDTSYQVAFAALTADLSDTEASEIRLRATRKLSSNFKVMGTYSIYEKTVADVVEKDQNSARFDFKYSF